MKEKKKRKLIGFIAGEKGRIGKLQALALGVAGVLAGGLIPNITKAWGDDDGWSGDWSGDWSGNWAGDWSDWWVWDNWTGDWTGDWDNWSNWTGDWTGDWPSDWSDWFVWDNWSGDAPAWTGNWENWDNWPGDWTGDWPSDWTDNVSIWDMVVDTTKEVVSLGTADTTTYNDIPESNSWDSTLDAAGTTVLGGSVVNTLINVSEGVQVVSDIYQEVTTWGDAETLTFNDTGEVNSWVEPIMDAAWTVGTWADDTFTNDNIDVITINTVESIVGDQLITTETSSLNIYYLWALEDSPTEESLSGVLLQDVADTRVTETIEDIPQIETEDDDPDPITEEDDPDPTPEDDDSDPTPEDDDPDPEDDMEEHPPSDEPPESVPPPDEDDPDPTPGGGSNVPPSVDEVKAE